MTTVYQVIESEYDEDDGHYHSDPYDHIVWSDEADANFIRDWLNAGSIRRNNDWVSLELVELADQGYNDKTIASFKRKNFVTADPTDTQAVVRVQVFQPEVCLTYYTVRGLELR